jgi:hypothetical protein
VTSLFAEEDKEKAGMGSYLHVGPFILALDSFYGLTSNFSCPITCFEAIFLFITLNSLLSLTPTEAKVSFSLDPDIPEIFG